MGIQCTYPPFLYSSRLSAIRKKRSTALSHKKRGVNYVFPIKPHLRRSLRDGKVAGLSVGPRVKNLNNWQSDR